MGRSGALPTSFFGAIEPRRRVPRNNVVLVGALIVSLALILPCDRGPRAYELAVSLVNFGALIAFMGVNAAAFTRYYVRADKKRWFNFAQPVLGFLVVCCSGGASARPRNGWAASGWSRHRDGAWKTGGFKSKIVCFELPPESMPDARRRRRKDKGSVPIHA